MTTANIIPTAGTDGIPYATNVPMTATEADLGDGAKTVAPIAVEEGQTVVAVVKLSVNGNIFGNTTMVFLQTDLGDGTWIDVAWCIWQNTTGSAIFVLCGGGLGAMNAAFQQTRNPSFPPATQSNGSNACPLGGRVRFSGFSKISGGSSSAPGVTTQVLATITYKIQNPR